MKKLFYLFSLLAFCSLIFTSCGDDNDEEVVAPQTGSIKAMVSPAGSATNMRITQGSITLEITPNNGVFQADNLQAGEYSVSFTPATGFQAPAARNTTVTGGNTTDLGTVNLVQPGNMFLGSFTANVNGNPWNSIIHGATIDSTGLTITGTVPNLTGATEIIVLNIANISGTGTFNAPLAVGVFTSTMLGGGANSWASAGPFGQCTITITKFDMTAKKVSGTFSFTGSPIPGSTASGTKTITTGTFTNLNIQ